MILRLTEKCSMGCSHCLNSCTPEGKHMSLDTLNDALEFLIDNGATSSVIVTGGEPTEHPEFTECMKLIIEKLARAHKFSGITITSNGFWCLEHPEEAKKIAIETPHTFVQWQISTDKRYYPKELPVHEKLWEAPRFVLCEDCVISMYPQGRALENGYSWSYKSSKCYNVRALAKQLPNPTVRNIVEELLRFGKSCTPAINIDGSISLGESTHCPKMASIYDKPSDIVQKIKDFHCHQCDFINENLPYFYRRFVD